MKVKKTAGVIGEQITSNGTTLGNVWVEPMFAVTNPKIINHPKFKELSSGARSFAALILENTPPGNDQKVALETLHESFLKAGQAFIRSQVQASI